MREDETFEVNRRGAIGTVMAGAAMMTFPGTAFAASDPVVETRHGRVRGATADGVHSFKGIRYAASTAAANRFMPPRPPEPWSGIADATKFGAIAPQNNANPPPGPPYVVTAQLPRPADAPPPPPRATESEDCLFLNVWTSGVNDGRKRPVMLWLHGGFFYAGSGGADGTALAARGDVVVVSINHRLNAFGYTHLADLPGGGDFRHSGNVGMLDIIAAIEWVRDNIDRFGGDPGRIMVFGESGGGMKTSFLMASPRAKDLFHRAAMLSGPGLKMMERDAATRVTELLMAETGARNVRALQGLPMDRLLAGYHATIAKVPAGDFIDLVGFAPVIDPELLPHHPFSPNAPAQSANVPMITGWSRDEMSFFLGRDMEAFATDEAGVNTRSAKFLKDRTDAILGLYRQSYGNLTPSQRYIRAFSDYSLMGPVTAQAERKAALRAAPVYVYRFDWPSPAMEGKLGALHTLTGQFVFDNASRARQLTGDTPEARALSKQISDAFVQFAATGDPNSAGNGLPRWPAYNAETRPTMLFNTKSEVAMDPAGAERKALRPLLTA